MTVKPTQDVEKARDTLISETINPLNKLPSRTKKRSASNSKKEAASNSSENGWEKHYDKDQTPYWYNDAKDISSRPPHRHPRKKWP